MRKYSCLLLTAATLVAASLNAQSVRGVARSENTARPIVGAVVQLFDSTQTPVARTLTSSSGVFVLPIPSPGRYEVRVLRIGYRAFSLRLRLATDTSIALKLSDTPWTLARFNVEETRECRVRGDTARLTSQLWEEIGKALLSTQVTRENGQYTFVASHHQRVFQNTNTLREIQLVERTSQGLSPWSSYPADSLARNGYLLEKGAVMTFVAPDIDVLLSSSFANTHCLRLAPENGKVLTMAIEFEPTQSVRNTDIRGRLTLNRQTRELVSLDFEYTKLPFVSNNRRAVGHIDFKRLAEGAWITPRWEIDVPVPERAPTIEPATAGTFSAQSRLATDVRRMRRVTSMFQVTGANLREVFSRAGGDSTSVLKSATSMLDVRVSMGADSVVSGALVQLTGTPTAARTNAQGVAHFGALFPGAYAVEATTAELQLLGRPPVKATVDVVNGANNLTRVALPSLETAVRTACRGRVVGEDATVLAGVVLNDGVPVVGADLLAIWNTSKGDAIPLAGLMARLDTLEQRSKSFSQSIPMVGRTTTNAEGRYVLCGVSTNATVAVRVKSGEKQAGDSLLIPRGTIVFGRTLVLRR